MYLEQIRGRVFYYPHQPETDRPMLAYVGGNRFALAIDAGNSAGHVDEFYGALEKQGLKKPDFTAITHWHWDHTFGMHHINGLSIAHDATNRLLAMERQKLTDAGYAAMLKKNNEYLRREYAGNKKMRIALPDIQFSGELTLDLGGITAQIFRTESPHSVDTVSIYIPEEKILFLGDATSGDYYNNGYMDRRKLEKLIRLIERTDCAYCVVSHAEPLRKPALLEYLKTV